MDLQEQDALLVSLVQSFTFLYDKKDKDFKNNLAKQNAWTTIGTIVKNSAVECEQRWIALRHRYTLEKRREKTLSHSGAGKYLSSTWPLFQSMGFLDNHVVPRRTMGNLKRKAPCMDGPSTSAAVSVWDTMQHITHQSDEMSEGSQQPTEASQLTEASQEDDFEMEAPVESTANPRASVKTPPTPKTPAASHAAVTSLLRGQVLKGSGCKPRTGEQEFMETMSQSLNGLNKYFKGKTESEGKWSAEDYFAKSVAESLKNIRNSKKRMEVQSRIMKELADAQSDEE